MPMAGKKKAMVKKDAQGRTPQMLFDSLRLPPLKPSITPIIPAPTIGGLSANAPKMSNVTIRIRILLGRLSNRVFIVMRNLWGIWVRISRHLHANIQHLNLFYQLEWEG